MTSTRGRLLVASPVLRDPNFARAVVAILEHNDDGALGLVLNRPAEVPVAAALPGWEGLAAAPAAVFVGGPVSPNSAICLGQARPGAAPADWTLCDGLVGSVDLSAEPEDLAPSLTRLRIFAGYAGWGGSQLEAELLVGSWLVLEPRPDDLFDPDPAGLWRRVLRRQGGSLAMAANCPLDPSMN